MKERSQNCQNDKLIGRLSGNIISGYMVHFDEIFRLLIDEILED